MAIKTISTCDRPGCGVEGNGRFAKATILIREAPFRDIAAEEWELCDGCHQELKSARILTDLAFGDRLRPENRNGN